MVEVNLPGPLAEMTAAFGAYERALMENDLEALDACFWADERAIRYGANESLYGIEAIRAFRRGRDASDMARDLRRTVITTFGTDYGTTNTEYVRRSTGRLGRQSQVWIRFSDGWRIVSAHVSVPAG